MSNVSAEVLNELFVAKLETEEGRTKLAGYQADSVKDRIREVGFADKILTPKSVDRADLQKSVNHDQLVKMVESEPFSRAATASFRGKAEVILYTAPRFEVPIGSIESMRYEQHDNDLKAYDVPITDIINKNIANDVSEISDRQLLMFSESAAQCLQKDANGVALNVKFPEAKAFSARNVMQTGVNKIKEVGKCKSVDVLQNTVSSASAAAGVAEDLSYMVQKDDLNKLFKLFIGTGGRGSRLEVDKALITNYDFRDINLWTIQDVGDKIAGETTVDGYKSNKTLGVSYIRTIKTDILRPGNIWAFAPEAYLGGYLVFTKLKFEIKREGRMNAFWAYKDEAMYIGNVAAVRKLELYAGSVDSIDAVVAGQDAIIAAYAPMAEEDLGKLNNLIADGGTVPNISSF